MDSLNVKEYGSNAGAAVVGIASSDDFTDAPDGFRPSDVLVGCRSVIIVGCPFTQESLLGTPAEYTDVRNAMFKRVDAIAKEVAKQIKKEGYRTKVLGGLSGKWVDGLSVGHISIKHAAELAGIGMIGKNYLLINKEYGTLLWFSAILTDAELVPDEKARYGICDDCNKCVEACPTGALDDISVFKKRECARTCFKMVNRKWELHCYLCRKICPHRFGIKL